MEKVEYIKRSDTLAKIYYLHIDGEKAIREYDRYKHKDDFTEALQEVVFEIDSIPSADVAEVKRGEWIEYPECLRYMNAYAPDHVVCSVCEECFSFFDDSIDRFDFCPHCGARMDGK